MKFLFIIESENFCSRYRVTHFCEQLAIHGIQSSVFYSKDCIPYKTLDSFDVYIIYRCAITSELQEKIRLIHSNNKKCLYDIDDYIFNYDDIKQFDFIVQSKSINYSTYSIAVHQCMELCDGYISSTNQLAKLIHHEFGEKPVFIKRNIASMEMAQLSDNAIGKKYSHQHIILGYFSGTHSHDSDFETIEKGLLKLLETHIDLHLYIAGHLNISSLFSPYFGRIQKIPLTDWHHLPALISKVDINLMPLQNTNFHNCKSENKWMEAALVKVPSVMPQNEELPSIIKAPDTGFFYNGEQQFISIIDDLMANPCKRIQTGNQAKHTVLKKHLTSSSEIAVIQSIISFCCGNEK